MSKYDPLRNHLASRGNTFVPMSFDEIERLLGFPLPPSSRRHRAWWSNNASNNVMTKAWMNAGYLTEDVDLEKEHLVFHRVEKASPSVTARTATGGSRHHDLIGVLRGMATVEKGYDLTAPLEAEWPDD